MSELPTGKEDLRASVLAGRAADAIRDHLESKQGPNELIRLSVEGVTAQVPLSAISALIQVLDAIAEGSEEVLAPADLQVGTLEAARVLGVSRPWVTKLIDNGTIAGTRSGSKRRIGLGELMRHRRHTRDRTRAALDREPAVIPDVRRDRERRDRSRAL